MTAEARTQLEEQLQADPWLQGRLRSVHVVGRTKSIYSTFKKMQRHNCGIEKINDLVALRVVLNPEQESMQEGGEHSPEQDNALCYHVLGKVHSSYTPLPRTLKDYISSPKPNGYRSLHTTVLVGTQPLEIQIRTQAMHIVAEHGAAAHWAYTEDKDHKRGSLGTRSAWTMTPGSSFSRAIAQWEELDCAHEFMQLVRGELLGTRVFIFTEKGRSTRILNLARGSTLADAAVMLSEPPSPTRPLSASRYTPLIAGVPAPLSTELKNGDIVSFVPAGTVVPPPDSLGTAAADALANTAARLATHGQPSTLPPAAVPLTPIANGVASASVADAAALDDENIAWRVCSRCLPLPGDPLVCTTPADKTLSTPNADGTSGSSGAGTLHRADCECLDLRRQLASGLKLIRPSPSNAARMDGNIQPHTPGGAARKVFATKIIVFTRDRPGMLLTVSAVVTTEVVNIINVKSETREVGGQSAFQYSVHVRSVEMMEALVAKLQELEDVVSVLRADMDDMLHDSKESFWENALEDEDLPRDR